MGNKLQLYFEYVRNWITERVGERSTADGIVLVAICLAVIFGYGLVKFVAWAGVAYGIWTIVKSEHDKRKA